MDRSLDEIIAEDTRGKGRPSGDRPSGGRRSQPRRRGDRDGVRKPYAKDSVNLNLDWVHDKFDDDRDSRPSRGTRHAGRSGSPGRVGPALTKVRVENLHYDITESDLEDLFGRIGPVQELSLVYDRAGRSEGVAFITYERLRDAHESVREFDGANAKGQPIRLSLVPGRRERTGGTLFDRVERPVSPESETEGGDRRRRGAGGRGRRSDMTKPAPDHIDRYIPGQRDTAHRSGGRRGGGRESRPRNAENPGRRSNARPRKTQEELDQEMEDYWGNKDADTEGTGAQPVQDAPVAADAPAAVAAPAVTDNDIDMIE
ncbi:Nucleotide-binding alpha-beta plait [Penicillium cinerascens]|uniref:Nucleotide-binding alpha-beta plait n=1 Tax=Penicillium cinerascens TaxID=70096 RepID=A0A9W9M8Q1_9EURO|nr:Nucleotide-binding alpha-beta plait [Penicillium cinerascens]KAJ5191227.1 Nucleotide-binding alpha-beta plait [Penicillium cinerascens]